ncbi:MAG: porin [Planctomycetaceae bacterium]|nr:porin [Planctomycetaceae bacterium]
MRSSLGQIFFSLVVGTCLVATAFGQARNQGAVQQAEYWQSSATPQKPVYQTVSHTDCGCSQHAAPVPTAAFNSCEPCGEVYGGCDTGCSTGCSTGGCYDTDCFGWNPCQMNQWFLTGWVQQGITINPYWPKNKSNGTLRYNDRANEYMMNQLYLTGGRAVNSEACIWDIGGRVDLLYGTDYYFTSALGWETRTTLDGYDVLDPRGADSRWNSNEGPRRGGRTAMYGLSMPQVYGEIQAPMGTNVKLGHFYSPMGHESVMATQNFFYSHSYSMMYGEPTTLTGMLLSQRITQNWTGYFGIHRGWDKWETPIDSISYLAGVKWENYCRTTSVGFLLNTGKDCWNNTSMPRQETNRMNYSLIFSHQLCPNLHYVLQHDLGIDQDVAYGTGIDVAGANYNYSRLQPLDGKWYSVAQYLYLQMTDTLAFGCRAEWFKDENHSRVLGAVPVNWVEGDEYVELTLGFNWKPTPFMTLRPEVRWDWIEGRNFPQPFKDVEDGRNSQFTIGTDLVITF